MINFSKVIPICLLAMAVGVGQKASAQGTYPQKPIKVVIGFSAGGGTDAVLRILASGMAKNLKVPVVVENRPGANGNIANQDVAHAQCDGYTLVYNTSSMVLSPYQYKDLAYDFRKDLKPIVLANNFPLLLAAKLDLPVQNVQELAQYLRDHPGSVNYASAGLGNITHLGMIQLLEKIGAQASHVPYRGEAPAMTDLMGGHVDIYMGTSAGMLPLVNDKRVKGMAVTSRSRMSQAPSLPTLAETLMPGTEIGAWSGFMAPACISEKILAKLNKAINEVLEDPEIRANLTAQGAEPRGSTVQEYADFIQSEYERWGKAFKAAGIKPE
ncbi:tripartite tricarboxylate transporter substrate binding protein [Alcaligenaceae bacterium]|nr:tripartite tricarboxylate transporter substrate binding protein [Alcaligenaceae bacterium]